MKIKVIGKVHREGTAKKTGNPYNFNQAHYTGPGRGVEGLAALALNPAPSLIPYADIKFNAEYCQRRCDFETFCRTGAVKKWRAKECSLRIIILAVFARQV